MSPYSFLPPTFLTEGLSINGNFGPNDTKDPPIDLIHTKQVLKGNKSDKSTAFNNRFIKCAVDPRKGNQQVHEALFSTSTGLAKTSLNETIPILKEQPA